MVHWLSPNDLQEIDAKNRRIYVWSLFALALAVVVWFPWSDLFRFLSGRVTAEDCVTACGDARGVLTYDGMTCTCINPYRTSP